jgi:hypothetical protein
VVECSGVVEKCGGPSAMPPRRDVAYFVEEKTAERDAKAFADYKNAQQEGIEHPPVSSAELQWHAAYPWDHQIHSPLIRWGVLEWNGKNGKPGPRLDVAYFLDPSQAESDARWFSGERDRWLAERPSHAEAPALTLARRVG